MNPCTRATLRAVISGFTVLRKGLKANGARKHV